MGASRVEFDAARYRLVVDGADAMHFESDRAAGPPEIAGPVLLSSLKTAFVRFLRHVADADGKVRLLVGVADSDYFDDGVGPFERSSVVVDDGEVYLDVAVMKEGEPGELSVEPVLEPLLRRYGAELIWEAVDEYSGAYELSVRIAWPIARRTVSDMLGLGADVEALLDAADGGELTIATALDLLRAGRWDLFRGQPESKWLEVKGEPYDSSTPTWRFELAKDVAAFANSPGGGLIVLGMSSRDAGSGDTITGHREFARRMLKRQTYRNAVARHVYLRLEGFEVERIPGPSAGKGFAVIIVPPQDPGSRPFLVQGVVRDGDVLGAHVLVPVRREDDTALLDASAIHARIRLGEQLIRGEFEIDARTVTPK
jgi:hypothetical protein